MATKKQLYFVADFLHQPPLPTPRHSSAVHLRLAVASARPLRRTLFVVRHGESEWNRAQAALDVGKMWSQVDHPLSLEGRRQAEGLAAHVHAHLQKEADAAAAAEARDAPGVPVRKHDAPAMALLCNVTMQHGRRTVSVHSIVEILNETHGPVEVRGRRTRPPCALALPSP